MLRQRVKELKDGMEQRERLENLIFSGPAIPAPAQGEQVGELMRGLLATHMSFSLDLDQVGAAFRLRNNSIMLKFKSASPNSDRDRLFRTKTRLRGSGLFISESLTRKRQEIFRELLGLKRRRSIHAAFTESGELFVRKTAESSPEKILD